MNRYVSFAGCALLVAQIGCGADVRTTEDSTKIEVQVPKVEVGKAPIDLNPDTDKDIDIDAPLPGDK